MFENEAEEISNKRCHEIMCFGHCSFSSPKHHRCGEWHREYNCAKEGIEYGYNKAKEDADKMKSRFLELCNLKDMRIAELEKANEWHYVKDGLPKENQLVMVYRVNPLGANIAITNWYDSYKDTKVIAWKEIVLPELKESI